MKVILVNGSPRKNGCTNRGLEEIKAQLRKEGIDSEIFWIGANVQGCVGCAYCKKEGHCVFTGDSVEQFLELARDADGFVFGSAVYYAGPTGSYTSFMDRVFYSGGKYLRDKPGASIMSCRRGGAASTFSQMNMYLTINHMPVVSSQYWNQIHGNTPEEVEQDIEGMQTMRTLAVNMSWLLKCIEAGKEQGIPLPEREKPTFTNFIRS